MRRVTLEQINSALGVTLSVEMVTTTLNVAQCDDQGRFSSNSGLWDAADYPAIRDRLINHLMYRVGNEVAAPPADFIRNFF